IKVEGQSKIAFGGLNAPGGAFSCSECAFSLSETGGCGTHVGFYEHSLRDAAPEKGTMGCDAA
ncbi:MAG: hypothetical protein WCS65_17880, partial [Verrucomicrobiae bacterium]